VVALLLLATSVSAFAAYRKAGGVSTDVTDHANGGVRAQVSGVTSPQTSIDNATQHFYTDEQLRDGSWYLAGTTMNFNGCGQSCYRFFAYAYDPSGATTTMVGSWTASNATHMVGFMATPGPGNCPSGSYTDWWAAFDGVRYANSDYCVFAVDSGPNGPEDWAETQLINGSGYPDPNDMMGYVNFGRPAMQIIYPGGSTWWDSLHASVDYRTDYQLSINVVPSGYQVFSAGTQLDQYFHTLPGDPLW